MQRTQPLLVLKALLNLNGQNQYANLNRVLLVVTQYIYIYTRICLVSFILKYPIIHTKFVILSIMTIFLHCFTFFKWVSEIVYCSHFDIVIDIYSVFSRDRLFRLVNRHGVYLERAEPNRKS